MDSSAGSVEAFFQAMPSAPGSGNRNNNSKDQGITLPSFLATLSALLPHPGTASELTAAFAAFDDADAGQADWAELRDVLVKEVASGKGGDSSNITTSEIDAVMDMFKGRRAFGGVGGGGSGNSSSSSSSSATIFRYHEFVAAVTGGNGNGNGSANGNGNGNGNNGAAATRVRA